ncbi:MAG: hypothetical protein NZ108_01535 [Bacteroidia bacterium]|nr:hypothetical protein [Bacteroidia bacterium]
MQLTKEQTYNATQETEPLLLFFWKWKKHILAATLFSALASILLSSSLVIDPKYRSEVVLFAPSTNSNNTIIEKEARFGDEDAADEHIQILQSGIIRNLIIEKYNLAKHYDIDTTDKKWKAYLLEEYENNITIERTKYNSIVIRVLDTDPITAANIANDISILGDSVRTSILKKNSQIAYEFAKKEYEDKLVKVASLTDSVEMFRVSNYNADVALARNLFLEKKRIVEELQAELDKIRKQFGVYELNEYINSLNEQLIGAKAAMVEDSGIVEVLKIRYTMSDSIMVRAVANYEGAKLKYKELQATIDKVTEVNKNFTLLTDKYEIEKKLFAAAQASLEEKTNSFEKVIPSFRLDNTRNRFYQEFGQMNELRLRYEKAKNTYFSPMPASYIVSKAEPNFKKAYPVRWLIVLVSTIAGLVLSIVTIAGINKFNELNYQLEEV